MRILTFVFLVRRYVCVCVWQPRCAVFSDVLFFGVNILSFFPLSSSIIVYWCVSHELILIRITRHRGLITLHITMHHHLSPCISSSRFISSGIKAVLYYIPITANVSSTLLCQFPQSLPKYLPHSCAKPMSPPNISSRFIIKAADPHRFTSFLKTCTPTLAPTAPLDSNLGKFASSVSSRLHLCPPQTCTPTPAPRVSSTSPLDSFAHPFDR